MFDALMEGPRHGYALKELAGLLLGHDDMHNNLVYPLLRRFVENSWVVKRTTDGQRGQKRDLYALTAKGRLELLQRLARFTEKEASTEDQFRVRVGLFSALDRDTRERLLDQRDRFLRKVRSALWTLRGKHLGVLGLAFKGGTDDIRESPAILIVQALLQEGCKITAYDPAAMERAQEAMSSGLKFASSSYEAAHGADALLILTEWEEFANLDLRRLNQELKYPIVIDGRNLYDPEVMAAHGFTYYSVGRAASHPETAPAASNAGTMKNGANPA